MTPSAAQKRIFASARIVIGALLLFPLAYILHVNLAVPALLLALAAFYTAAYTDTEDYRYCRFLNLSFLFVIVFTASYLIVREGFSLHWIPFSLAPMLCVLLYNNLNAAALLSLASAVAVGAVAGNSLRVAALFLISGIVGSIIVLGARRRATIIKSGFIIGLIQVAAAALFDGFHVVDPYGYALLFFNGVYSSIFVLGTLPVFEYLFGNMTNVSLLELADFNHPIMQRMILEAPGTYHHSLVVGNLSEAASAAVGANPLLARIGAYYHDIGKLSKPEYFSENQFIAHNKHDALTPEMSKLVIMNHVKEGLELAKQHKINPKLYDFIGQHHGTSLVFYFYRRALEASGQDEEVSEEGFRYPGPRPRTKETAIVLLADSVEAATRALKDPAPASIEELVRKIINNKFIDGQLDECDLTLRDLEKIAAVFARILGAIYHSRVAYPNEERHERNNHRTEPAKKDPL